MTHWTFVAFGPTVFMPKSKLKDKQEHFQKGPPKCDLLPLLHDFLLDQDAEFLEALSATDPNIPAGRPSEKVRRANKHINNNRERTEMKIEERDRQAPHR